MPRFRAALALLLALPAAAAAAVWLLGRIFTDALPQTQYLFWIPSLFLLPPAALLGAGAWAVHAVGRPPRRVTPRQRRHRTYLAMLALICVGCLIWQLLVGWRLHRRVLPARSIDPARAVHLFHWNMTAQAPHAWDANLARLPDDPAPDILLLTNTHQGTRFRELRERTDMNTASWAHLTVASRYPILRSKGASLRLPRPEEYPTHGGDGATDAAPQQDPRARGWYDPGQILFAELDTTETLGQPIVVCLIDLPSDPSIPRRDVATLVLTRLNDLDAQWNGGDEFDGVPLAHVIAGDFNMTRGSASLGRITEGLVHAFEEAGSGFVATYPSPGPLWHIDHIFVRPPLTAARYDVEDLGGSAHLAQHAVIIKRDRR